MKDRSAFRQGITCFPRSVGNVQISCDFVGHGADEFSVEMSAANKFKIFNTAISIVQLRVVNISASEWPI